MKPGHNHRRILCDRNVKATQPLRGCSSGHTDERETNQNNCSHGKGQSSRSASGRTLRTIYFGTTSGEVWASTDEGASWAPVAQHLPEIYSVEVG